MQSTTTTTTERIYYLVTYKGLKYKNNKQHDGEKSYVENGFQVGGNPESNVDASVRVMEIFSWRLNESGGLGITIPALWQLF